MRAFRRACSAGWAGPLYELASEGGLGWVREPVGAGAQGLTRVGESSVSQIWCWSAPASWVEGGLNKGAMGSSGTLVSESCPPGPCPEVELLPLLWGSEPVFGAERVCAWALGEALGSTADLPLSHPDGV